MASAAVVAMPQPSLFKSDHNMLCVNVSAQLLSIALACCPSSFRSFCEVFLNVDGASVFVLLY
jgi:hypothetical protein